MCAAVCSWYKHGPHSPHPGSTPGSGLSRMGAWLWAGVCTQRGKTTSHHLQQVTAHPSQAGYCPSVPHQPLIYCSYTLAFWPQGLCTYPPPIPASFPLKNLAPAWLSPCFHSPVIPGLHSKQLKASLWEEVGVVLCEPLSVPVPWLMVCRHAPRHTHTVTLIQQVHDPLPGAITLRTHTQDLWPLHGRPSCYPGCRLGAGVPV